MLASCTTAVGPQSSEATLPSGHVPGVRQFCFIRRKCATKLESVRPKGNPTCRSGPKLECVALHSLSGPIQPKIAQKRSPSCPRLPLDAVRRAEVGLEKAHLQQPPAEQPAGRGTTPQPAARLAEQGRRHAPPPS